MPGAVHWLFARGHAADVVLAVMAVELAWLAGARGWRPGAALVRLAPGALMVVALRAALTGLAWYWVALPLLLSFPVHLADLEEVRRKPRRGRRRAR